MDINKVTLECLVNPSVYKNIQRNNYNEQGNETGNKPGNKPGTTSEVNDMEFYKNRIIDLTTKLFDEKTENIGLRKAFYEYVNECIIHLYANDMTYTYQKEYDDISFGSETNMDLLFDISGTNNFIIKKKEDTKLTNYVNKRKKNKQQQKYPVTKEFNPKDDKFKEHATKI